MKLIILGLRSTYGRIFKMTDDEIVDKVSECMEKGGTAFGIPPHEWTDLVLDWLVNNVDLSSAHYTFLFSKETCRTALKGRVRAQMIAFVNRKIDGAYADQLKEWGVECE